MKAIPTLSRQQMVEIDRLMIEEARISLLQMMENAGRALAEFVINQHHPSNAAVFVGRGGNGGGGLVAARHLANRGVDVAVITASADRDYVGVSAHQLQAVMATSARVLDDPPPQPDVIVDALVGYSLSGAPTGRALDLINAIGLLDSPVVSLDIPSGVDSDSGECPGASVMASSTLTLALPKTGLALSPNTGSLHLADISVPAALYRCVGVEVPTDLFAESQIIDLD